MKDRYTFKGAIHIHSNYSDGSGSPEEIINAAANAGLDFIIFSDHFSMDAQKYDGKTSEGVFVITGYEWGERKLNHSLILNVNKVYDQELNISEVIDNVKNSNGILFMAHPDDMNGHEWNLWDDIDGISGVEIWNFMSKWRHNSKGIVNIKNLFNPMREIDQPTNLVIDFWDEINMKRKFPAIGSLDTHAYKMKIGLFTTEIYSYKFCFNTIRTNICLNTDIKDLSYTEGRKLILNSLVNGESYIINRYIRDSNGVDFLLMNNLGEYLIGSEVVWDDDTYIIVKAPVKFSISVYRFGKCIFEDCINKTFTLKVEEPGNYRLVLKLKKQVWIYTNHFYIV